MVLIGFLLICAGILVAIFSRQLNAAAARSKPLQLVLIAAIVLTMALVAASLYNALT